MPNRITACIMAHLSSESCEKKNGYPMYVIFGAVVASVGGVLFGYDIGITSGALLQLRDDFNLTSFEQELVVSSVLAGALCASFFGELPFYKEESHITVGIQLNEMIE
ncbi:uncharacterized protein TNCV_2134961 [Trichonephila clavipes]|nr:uncharacterized protein TNCV_2134961 [Trichonephila clavipes]